MMDQLVQEEGKHELQDMEDVEENDGEEGVDMDQEGEMSGM